MFTVSAQTMVQACLYPLGRSAEVFEDPQRFEPARWGKSREEGQKGAGTGFRSLAFGFGARQCVGRRIAENEMQLLLMHVSVRGARFEGGGGDEGFAKVSQTAVLFLCCYTR